MKNKNKKSSKVDFFMLNRSFSVQKMQQHQHIDRKKQKNAFKKHASILFIFLFSCKLDFIFVIVVFSLFFFI